MKEWYPKKNCKLYLPNPSWPNHNFIAESAGFETETYRYYDPATKGLILEHMLEDLDKAENESIVLFHACAHNPTGCDPSPE